MKIIKSLSFVLICILFTLLAGFLPMSDFYEEVQAQEIVGQTLISKNISAQDYSNVYGGTNPSEWSRFAPFDFELGMRVGASIVPTSNANKEIESAKYNLAPNGGLNLNDNNLSFGAWFYFSTTNVHALKIKISIDQYNFFHASFYSSRSIYGCFTECSCSRSLRPSYFQR